MLTNRIKVGKKNDQLTVHIPYKIVFEFTMLALFQTVFLSTKMPKCDVLAPCNAGRSYNLDFSVELDYDIGQESAYACKL